MKKTYLLELALVFIMALVAYGYFSTKADWNTSSRLSLVKAVVEQNRFEIDSYQGGDLFTKDAAKFLGHYYTDKAIGASLVGISFYLPLYTISKIFGSQIPIQVFKELITFLAISLLCAFLAPLLYSFVKKISMNSRFALLVTCGICFGTGLYTYSTFYYAHSLVALFLFVIFFIWFNIKDEEKISPLKIIISGYLMGYAVITEYPTILIVFGLGLYVLYVLWKKLRLFDLKVYARLLIGFAVPAVVAMLYNYAVFHNPFKTGYGYEMLPVFNEAQHSGLMGIGLPDLNVLFYMTFHPTMGVFWQSPFLLFAFIGWFRMWKDNRYRPEALLSFGIIFGYFLIMSGYYQWWGGAAFTPRGLLPVFPFWGIPLAFLVKKWEKYPMLILVFISIIQVLIVTATKVNNDLYAIMINMQNISINSMFQQPSTIYNGYLPTFLKQGFTPNRGREFLHLTGFSSLLPLLLIELSLLVIFFIISKRNAASPPIENH